MFNLNGRYYLSVEYEHRKRFPVQVLANNYQSCRWSKWHHRPGFKSSILSNKGLKALKFTERTNRQIGTKLCAIALIIFAFAFFRYVSKKAYPSSPNQWVISADEGFGEGSTNFAAGPIVQYQGKLYCSTINENGAEIWEKTSEGDWQKIVDGGFGDKNNIAILRMITYNDFLYAGTLNLNGCQLWRFDGSQWSNALSPEPGPGFGNAHNIAITAMELFEGKLYVGTTNYRLDILLPGSDGADIWCYDGATWTRVALAGFGDNLNAGVTSLKTYNGTLYAGTARFKIQVSVIDPENVRVSLVSMGCQLRRKTGNFWTLLAQNGFNDSGNVSVSAMAVYAGKLFLGTANGNLSVTVNIESGEISDISYSSSGLYIYSFDGSQLSQAVGGGFGDANNFAVLDMIPYNSGSENLLLAGCASSVSGGLLMAYNNQRWYAGADPGFGNASNKAVSSLLACGNTVFSGTYNDETGCEVWSGKPPSKPLISSISPTSAPVGTIVTINGTNFGCSREDDSFVSFGGGIASEYVVWNDTTIQAKVPSDATSGDVKVITPYGTSNGITFTVIDKPQISSISPTSGCIGAEVSISGSCFGSEQQTSCVYFGTRKVGAYLSWANNLIKCKVPSGISGQVSVKVITPVGESNSATFKVKPEISAISPTSGTPGTYVTIAGSAFGNSRGSSYVTFGSKKVSTYSSWTDTKLKIKVPSGVSKGKTTIKVTTSGGTSNGASFTVK